MRSGILLTVLFCERIMISEDCGAKLCWKDQDPRKLYV